MSHTGCKRGDYEIVRVMFAAIGWFHPHAEKRKSHQMLRQAETKSVYAILQLWADVTFNFFKVMVYFAKCKVEDCEGLGGRCCTTYSWPVHSYSFYEEEWVRHSGLPVVTSLAVQDDLRFMSRLRILPPDRVVLVPLVAMIRPVLLNEVGLAISCLKWLTRVVSALKTWATGGRRILLLTMTRDTSTTLLLILLLRTACAILKIGASFYHDIMV